MSKKEAKNTFRKYLKERNIEFYECISDGEASIVLLLTGYENCPDKVLECSVYFYNSYMECRVYYSENAAGWISERAGKLSGIYCMLNFINAMVWPFAQNGIGGSDHLQTSRFYITEDGNYDLTATSVIDYKQYAMMPLEITDYCTVTIPELMDQLSIPLFLVLLEEITIAQGIAIIKKDILKY